MHLRAGLQARPRLHEVRRSRAPRGTVHRALALVQPIGARAPGAPCRAQISRRLSLGRVNTLLAVLSRPARAVNRVATAPSSSGGGAPTCLARARRVGRRVRRGLVCRCRRRSATAVDAAGRCHRLLGPGRCHRPWVPGACVGCVLTLPSSLPEVVLGAPSLFPSPPGLLAVERVGTASQSQGAPPITSLEGTNGLHDEPCPAPPGTGETLRHPVSSSRTPRPLGPRSSSPRD